MTDDLEQRVLSKLREILVEKGSHLKIGGPSVGRSFQHPDVESCESELEVSISVRRVDREKRMPSGEAREAREIAREIAGRV